MPSMDEERSRSHESAEPLLRRPTEDVVLFDSDHHQHDRPGASFAQAVFVLVNIYVGNGLLRSVHVQLVPGGAVCTVLTL